MKKIAVFLNGPIKNDPRVVRITRSLAKIYFVDIFYINGHENDSGLFDKNVNLYFVPKKDTFIDRVIKRTLFYYEYMFLYNEAIKVNKKYDYIYANDLPCLAPAVKFKKSIGGQLIYDSHEIYIETINQFFLQTQKPLKSLIHKINIKCMQFLGMRAEKRLLQDVDKFITVGAGLLDYFSARYTFIDSQIIMNCPILQDGSGTVDLHSMIGKETDVKIFLYQGVLNAGRGLELLLDAFEFTNQNCVLVLLGNGILKTKLQNMVYSKNLEERVFFFKAVPFEQLPNYTKAAYCGINLLENYNLSKALVAPNKLFEYIHAEIPVIASYSFENDLVFGKYNIGIQVENEVKMIYEAVNQMATVDVDKYREYCKVAKNEYNWQVQEHKLLNFIK